VGKKETGKRKKGNKVSSERVLFDLEEKPGARDSLPRRRRMVTG